MTDPNMNTPQATERVAEQERMREMLFGRIMRRQYAHNKPRRAAVVTHKWVWNDRSKYVPHQGKAEMARRVAKRTELIERGMHESELFA